MCNNSVVEAVWLVAYHYQCNNGDAVHLLSLSWLLKKDMFFFPLG